MQRKINVNKVSLLIFYQGKTRIINVIFNFEPLYDFEESWVCLERLNKKSSQLYKGEMDNRGT